MESQRRAKIELAHYVDPDLQREAIVYSELEINFFRDTEKDYLKMRKTLKSM
jgi:hypothetical protein